MSKFKYPRDVAVIKFLFRITAPYKKWSIACLILSFSSITTALLLTFFTEQLVSQTVGGHVLPATVWFFVLLVLASALLGGLSGVASSRLGAYAGRDLKQKIANQVMTSDYRAIQEISAGDAISTMNNDCGQITTFLMSDLFSLVTQILTAAAAFIYLLWLNPLLGLISFVYTPIGMTLASKINNRMNSLYPRLSDQKGETLSAVEQAIASVPVIKSFCLEGRIMKKLDAVFENLYKTDRQIKFWDALLQPACLSVANTPNLLFMIVGGLIALSGKLELGTFIAISQLLGYIIPPTVMLPFLLNNLNQSKASMHRINKIIQLPLSSDNKYQPFEWTPSAGYPSIQIESLSFCYNSSTPVLKDISVTIESAGITAMVGSSGSGKTTLLSLISGLYKPDMGSIRINGEDASKLKESDLLNCFSVLPQDVHLFSDTILDNIRVGKQDADDFEVYKAAKATKVYDFAAEKEHGLDTVIGDGGSDLSGGQAQKLGLARAYLKNAPIWILDEPTSALDPNSEADLHKLLRELSANKVILVAAHRLSTIRLADKIIFLENGTVSHYGTWDELKQNEEFIKTVHGVQLEESGATMV